MHDDTMSAHQGVSARSCMRSLLSGPAYKDVEEFMRRCVPCGQKQDRFWQRTSASDLYPGSSVAQSIIVNMITKLPQTPEGHDTIIVLWTSSQDDPPCAAQKQV
jgi:hypothetical protein